MLIGNLYIPYFPYNLSSTLPILGWIEKANTLIPPPRGGGKEESKGWIRTGEPYGAAGLFLIRHYLNVFI